MKKSELEKLDMRTRCWHCVRANCCSVRDAFKKFYCTTLFAKTGNTCEELKPLAHFAMMFSFSIMFLLTCGVVTAIGLIIYNQSKEPPNEVPPDQPPEVFDDTQVASVISASTDINILAPEKEISDVFSKCNLNNGEWVRWFGKINQDFEDKTHFTLPVNSGSALFKYIGKIEDFSSCEFVFIPTSESSINYVISLDEIYQIVIGDNDFWTVALRATDAVGGDLVYVGEDVSDKTRPRLSSKVKTGTVVRAVLNQGFIDNDKYQIELVVTYKPDTTELDELQTSTFSWTIDPSPAIHEKPSLSVGLIRAFGDKSEIGVKFVNPSVVQEHLAETD